MPHKYEKTDIWSSILAKNVDIFSYIFPVFSFCFCSKGANACVLSKLILDFAKYTWYGNTNYSGKSRIFWFLLSVREKIKTFPKY